MLADFTVNVIDTWAIFNNNSADFNVVLDFVPSREVTIPLNASCCISLPRNLTFSPSNWNVTQHVIVTAPAASPGTRQAIISLGPSLADDVFYQNISQDITLYIVNPASMLKSLIYLTVIRST